MKINHLKLTKNLISLVLNVHIFPTDHLEKLERGEMVKDYNANTTSGGADSEDEEDPRTPTSVSSQGSQGYDSAGSDFVDIEGFASIPDSSLPELQLQVIKKTTLSSHYKPTMIVTNMLLYLHY